MQKYGKFMETRFLELKHESKMRLLRTHSHTSERRDYEGQRQEGPASHQAQQQTRQEMEEHARLWKQHLRRQQREPVCSKSRQGRRSSPT